tara:strand:+ start:5794 stop:6012 length:219 start_codon:yes stop_codon:yes gene_type:complete
MTPKEKAIELTNRFAKVEPYFPTKETVLFMYEAKQCANICVTEILNDNPNIYDSDRLNHIYWKEVKEQIRLL